MTQQPRPGVEKVQVAAMLRRMREQAGLTREDAAGVLGCTTSKIGDLETGRSTPKTGELGLLLDRYGVGENERAELLDFARSTRRRRPRGEAPGALVPLHQRRLADLEAQATSAVFWSGELIPGALQTRGYAEALMHSWGEFTDQERHDRLELRLQRSVPLQRTDREPLQFWCVLGEAALRSGVGGPAVMREQIEHLLAWNRARRNVVVQILPQGAGVHHFLGLTVTLLRFPSPAGGVVYTDALNLTALLDGEREVAEAAHALDLLRAQALGPDDSAAILDAVLHDLEEG